MEGVCNDVLAMIHRYVHRANMNNVMVELRYQTCLIRDGFNEYCCVANSYNYIKRIIRINYKNRLFDWDYIFK